MEPVAGLFPQTNMSSGTMIHLWPKDTGLAMSVVSWAGLDYIMDIKERSNTFLTFLNFIDAFISLNNLKLRILVGGLYNVDTKLAQFWRFNNLTPMCFKTSPYPYQRKDLKCTFIYTKETLKVRN